MTRHDEEAWRLPGIAEVEDAEDYVPPRIDTSVAHPARMYDYYLGGKDNFAADRAAAEKIVEFAPEALSVVREARDFLHRALRYTAAQGIDQYLDIGTGIPGEGAVHRIVRESVPHARVVYVDNDPVVLAHARALLTDARGEIAYLGADVREPGKILESPQVRELIDFDRPVVVVLAMILYFLRDADEPRAVVERLREVLAPGSHVIVSHVTYRSDELKVLAEEVYEESAMPMVLRTAEEIAAFLDGLELVEPGLVQAPLWRPEEGRTIEPDLLAEAHALCAVGRVP